MTDRELLELAAKACGYTIRENGKDVNGGTWYWCEQIADCWNPLNDDGDAFRLGVALTMEIDHNHPADHSRWVSVRGAPVRQCCVEEFEDEGLRGAATRLAIFRAAVEIGRAT